MPLHDLLEAGAEAHPRREFAAQGSRRLTYQEAAAATNRIGRTLIERGLSPGDRVAVLSRNSIDMVLLYFACARAGVVPVPLNVRLAAAEWQYIINDALAKALFVAEEFRPAIEGIRAGLPLVKRLIALTGPGDREWEAWQEYESSGAATPFTSRVTPDHDLYQMYTSGTTGRPKGAVLTHAAVTANAAQIARACDGRPGERSLVVAPLFHAAAIPAAFAPIAWGGSLFVLDQFDPGEVVRVLDDERIGFAVLIPAMLQACFNGVPDIDRRRFEHLRLIYYGSSPIAETTLRRALAVFGCGFIQSYGLTEAAQSLTFLTPADHERALNGEERLLLSAGRAADSTELRIVDSGDTPLPTGTTGEVIARGPQMMRGYWNLPDATAETLRGGWLHTGDAGFIDGEGYLYIQDRVKDMIVSGGENVYPREVEEVLFQHPAVLEAAVIGVPHGRWGETVKAVIVLREGEKADAEEIIDFCRSRLGGFKLPRSVDFVAALPRNATGKVLKRELRDRYWAGHERRVAGA